MSLLSEESKIKSVEILFSIFQGGHNGCLPKVHVIFVSARCLTQSCLCAKGSAEMRFKMEQVQGVISRLGEKKVLGAEECMEFCDMVQQNGSVCQDAVSMGKNEVVIEFGAQSRNEGFARMAAAAYASQLNPTLEEIADIKTAVSEAVTNAVIHGYGEKNGTIRMRLSLEENEIQIEISDRGIGMENVLKAMEPLYTTRPDMERSGMGFAFMEAFMDELEVHSRLNFGTVVRMKKKIALPDSGGSDRLE